MASPNMDEHIKAAATHNDTVSEVASSENMRKVNRENPQTWPRWWKIIILLNISFFNMLGNLCAAGIPPVQAYLMKDLGISLVQAGHVTTYTLLTLGLANIYAVPITCLIGKRYTILAFMVLFLVANIWSAVATSYSSLIGSRIVAGLGGGIIESLGPPMVEELFDIHELGRAMVVYTSFLAAGSMLGPLFAGFIASGTGNWRWYIWFVVIATACNLVTSVILLPETTYPVEIRHDNLIESTTGIEQDNTRNSGAEDKAEYITKYGDSTTTEPTWTEVWRKNSFFLRHPYVKHPHSWLKLIFDPFVLLAVPGVLVLVIVFGLSIALSVVQAVTVSAHFGSPPLLWKASSIGLLNVAPLISLCIGTLFGGVGADYLTNRARRLRGEPNPEARLPIIIFAGIISPVGFIIIGVGLQNNLHWISVAIGIAMSAFGITAGANVLLTYCVDVYAKYAAQISVTVNVFKNVLGFGLSYSTVVWYESSGPLRMNATMAGLVWFAYLLIVPLYFYGKRLRLWSHGWLT